MEGGTAKNRVKHENAYRHVDKNTNGLTVRLGKIQKHREIDRQINPHLIILKIL
jgi:hypothetical protein